MAKNYFSIYLVRNRVLAPAQAMTRNGYYFETTPVAVHDIADELGVVTSIVSELNQEHPMVSFPSRDSYPKPAVLAPAGLKSWNALEKEGKTWAATLIGNTWRINSPRTNEKGKWEANPAAEVVLGGDIPLEQLARQVVELVKNARMAE